MAFVFIQGHIDLGVCGMRLATAKKKVQNSFGICLSGFDSFLAFFPGTICLVFATAWN